MSGVSDHAEESGRWGARPVQAWTLRGVVFLAPFAVSLRVRSPGTVWIHPPTSSLWVFLGWWFGISGAATVVLIAVDRLSRRLLPLSALLQALARFPGRDAVAAQDRAAIRRVDSLEARMKLVDAAKAATTPKESAARLLELVAALNAHDRLTRGHSERVRAYSVLIGKQMGSALTISTCSTGPRCSTTSASSRWSRRSSQTGPPLGRGVGAAAAAPAPRRGADRAAARLARALAGGGRLPPRALGRQGLPARAQGEEIPIAGRIVAVADYLSTSSPRRAPTSAPDSSVLGREEIAALRRRPVRPGRRAGVPQRLAGPDAHDHGARSPGSATRRSSHACR